MMRIPGGRRPLVVLGAAMCALLGSVAWGEEAAGAAARGAVPRAVLPPGDIAGRLIESDGVTPHAGVAVTLRRVGQEEAAAATVADEGGRFLFERVPQGEYVVYIGNPGIGALLSVRAGATPGTLEIVVPKALSLPAASGALPEWWNQQSNTNKALIGGGGVLALGGIAFYYIDATDKNTGGKVLSPIGPGRRWRPPKHVPNDDDDDDLYP